MPDAAGRTASARALAPWIFVAVSGFLGALSVGHVDSADGAVMFRVTEALVERGALDVRQLDEWQGFGGSWTVEEDGSTLFRAKYGLGLSLVAAPLYLVGEALLPLASEGERSVLETGASRAAREWPELRPCERVARDPRAAQVAWHPTDSLHWREAFLAFMVSLTNAFVTGGVIATVYLCALELRLDPLRALIVADLALVGSPLLPYSRTFFSEPLGAWCVLLAVLAGLRARAATSPPLWLLSGLALGASVLVKTAHAVLLIPGLVYLLVGTRWMPLPERRRSLAAFVAGLVGPLVLVAAYNQARFSVPWESGYGSEVEAWTTPLHVGLLGLVASPGRGIVLYWPAVIVAVAGLPRLYRRAAPEALFVALSSVVVAATYARWHQWDGGWCWGPRYLLPLVPLLALSIGCVLDSAPLGRLARAGLAALLLASIAIALSGLLVHFVEFDRTLACRLEDLPKSASGEPAYYEPMRWAWAESPLLRYWTFEPRAVPAFVAAAGAPGVVLGVLLAMMAAGVAGFVGLILKARRVLMPA